MVRKNVRDNAVYVSNGYDTRAQYGREIPIEEMHWITENPFELDKNAENIFHSVQTYFSIKSLFLLRWIQMMVPTMIRAIGGSSIRLLFIYP